MASFKVEVISRELIKPSSPTPSHLNAVQLSFLDQFAPSIYIPLVFFYQNELVYDLVDNAKRSLLLKKSLSDTLVPFYPLAGRVKGNESIDCNDEGVEFYEANVSSKLLEVMENPKIENLRGLLPFEPISHDKNIVLGVQVNHFSCGGIAISVCISHKIADAKALVDFVEAWAMMTQGFEEDDHAPLCPKFDGASYFPPRDLNGICMSNDSICMEKIVTRRFVFDKKSLDALKEQVTQSIDKRAPEKAPTRVEAVSAFLWKHIIEATQKVNSCLNMTFTIVHAVNLRKRRAMPIEEGSFGNFWWASIGTFSAGQSNEPSSLVTIIREAIRKIDYNFIKMLEHGNIEFLSEMKKGSVGMKEICRFSSWCRFPLYEVNFGWGKPAWVCTTTLPFKNVVILLSTKCGEGIEAWINMLEDDITLIEQDLEHLSH